MGITITRPSTTVDVITDLQALREALEAAQDIQQGGATPKTRLKALKRRVDESTLVLHLHGLTSSRWNMIVVKRTRTDGDRIVKDWPGMIADALPDMLDKAEWKTSKDPVDLSGDALSALLDSMSDTQTRDVMVTVQELNTPVTTVPKALADLL